MGGEWGSHRKCPFYYFHRQRSPIILPPDLTPIAAADAIVESMLRLVGAAVVESTHLEAGYGRGDWRVTAATLSNVPPRPASSHTTIKSASHCPRHHCRCRCHRRRSTGEDVWGEEEGGAAWEKRRSHEVGMWGKSRWCEAI